MADDGVSNFSIMNFMKPGDNPTDKGYLPLLITTNKFHVAASNYALLLGIATALYWSKWNMSISKDDIDPEMGFYAILLTIFVLVLVFIVRLFGDSKKTMKQFGEDHRAGAIFLLMVMTVPFVLLTWVTVSGLMDDPRSANLVMSAIMLLVTLLAWTRLFINVKFSFKRKEN